MFECKKIVLVLTGLFCFGAAMPAAAETEEAVLLKVHNVVPLKDGSNQTIGCEFNTTIYNRSNVNINDITVELKWLDETTRNTAANADKKTAFGNYIAQAPVSENAIISTVDIPSLQAFRQKTIKSKIDGTNCFLLMKDPEINVKGCKIQERKNNFSCSGIFRFVPSIDPQYYTEFKPVSINDQATQENAQKDADKKEIDTLFNQVETNINKVSAILNK